ncbi:baculoviral IAP repeat-containing protein 5.2-like [Sycon ciliatum]|uniref:baculoviral IAP repeat-containing protein 5.2-like n=1 Tax=Sycon ciliatum TaxID=27933 RepID=UPI0020ADE6B6|eukprot:scpid103143/ scgid24909/ Baculoviral IAP repeat-containing protein 5.2; Survivin 2
MASASKSPDSNVDDEFALWNYEERLATFAKHSWPFTVDCTCTPENMAKAGFFHIPSAMEPDLVRCFVCQKELDGWDPDDDPWSEHKSHSAKCPFLLLSKDIGKLTVKDFLALELKRQVARAEFFCKQELAQLKKEADVCRKELDKLT